MGSTRSAAFLGIPFAQAPVGDLRFQAPQPITWAEVRNATAYGPTPVRRNYGEATFVPEPAFPGEAILNLNVFTPDPSPDAHLPVFVWIHGGGYTAGSPDSSWYDGATFNRDGVVTVSLSYRLGVEGFAWMEGAPANRGLLDQIAGLEWIQKNIAAFGGDPDRVTLGGQSAGGGSAMDLLASPRAAGLFRAVISLSGATPDTPLELAKEAGRTLATIAGIEASREAWCSLSISQVLAAEDEFQERNHNYLELLRPGTPSIPIGPVVDGEVLPYSVPEALRRGIGADVALLAGATDHEYNMIGPRLQQATNGRDPAEVLAEYGVDPKWAQQFIRAHQDLEYPGLQLAQAVSYTLFHKPLAAWLEARAGTLHTWRYRFAWPTYPPALALHCFDIPFAFDCLTAERVHKSLMALPPQSLADLMHGDLVHFITEGAAPWNPWEPAHEGRIYSENPTVGPIKADQAAQ